MSSDDFQAQVVSVAALGDPIRRVLYEYVIKELAPVSRDQAAAGVQVARHIAKFHLDKLEDEGLLEVEFSRPSGRRGPGAGRPTKFYRRSSRQFTVSLPERRYDLAGHLLAHAITTSKDGGIPVAEALCESARSFGQTLAEEVNPRIGACASQVVVTEALVEVLANHGYEPRIDGDGIKLANCPFHNLAREYPALVCGMCKDLIQGLLAALPTKLEAHLDPAPEWCCITLVMTGDEHVGLPPRYAPGYDE